MAAIGIKGGINFKHMRKLLACIIEENLQMAQHISAALQRTNGYETLVFSNAGAYLNYHGNRPDLMVVNHQYQYAAAQPNFGNKQNQPKVLVLKPDAIVSDTEGKIAELEPNNGSEEPFKKLTHYAYFNKLKHENQALVKMHKIDKAYILLFSSLAIGLYYFTFLLQ